MVGLSWKAGGRRGIEIYFIELYLRTRGSPGRDESVCVPVPPSAGELLYHLCRKTSDAFSSFSTTFPFLS